MNRNRLLIPDGQTIAGGSFGTVDGHFAFDDLDPDAAFRSNLVNRLLIFQQDSLENWSLSTIAIPTSTIFLPELNILFAFGFFLYKFKISFGIL